MDPRCERGHQSDAPWQHITRIVRRTTLHTGSHLEPVSGNMRLIHLSLQRTPAQRASWQADRATEARRAATRNPALSTCGTGTGALLRSARAKRSDLLQSVQDPRSPIASRIARPYRSARSSILPGIMSNAREHCVIPPDHGRQMGGIGDREHLNSYPLGVYALHTP